MVPLEPATEPHAGPEGHILWPGIASRGLSEPFDPGAQSRQLRFERLVAAIEVYAQLVQSCVCHSDGVSVRIESAWISSRIRSPSAA